MKIIQVKIPGRNYPVYIGIDVFKRLTGLIKKHKLCKNIFLIVDDNVYSLYKEKIETFILQSDGKTVLYKFKADENNKSLYKLEEIYSQLSNNGFGRDTLIIAIGGGVIGDIAGMAASTFSRGIEIVHVPTTLLAMVDSSVGGKTGVNFEGTKNLIGTFYQPKFVLVDTNFLPTLSREEILCGAGEVVKYSLLIGDDFFNYVKKNLSNLLLLKSSVVSKVIFECVKFKASIVEKDEREESGLRKILNLGHTFGHAIEVEQNYTLKHGEAVICGLSCTLHLTNKLKLLNDDNLAKYLSLIVELSDFVKMENCDYEKIFEIMKRDKKSRDDQIKYVLLKRAGDLLIDVEADKDDVIYSLNNGLQYFS